MLHFFACAWFADVKNISHPKSQVLKQDWLQLSAAHGELFQCYSSVMCERAFWGCCTTTNGICIRLNIWLCFILYQTIETCIMYTWYVTCQYHWNQGCQAHFIQWAEEHSWCLVRAGSDIIEQKVMSLSRPWLEITFLPHCRTRCAGNLPEC